MANRDNPHGLLTLGRNFNGGMPHLTQWAKAVGLGTALFPGDAVIRLADGSISSAFTAGTSLFSGVNLNWGAASTATSHIVIDDDRALFEAQDDGAVGIVVADEGLNANLIAGAGSATTQKSGQEVNGATLAVTATLDVHILELLKQPDNEPGAFARVVIMFNKHRMIANTVGV